MWELQVFQNWQIWLKTFFYYHHFIYRTGAKVCSDGCALIQEDGQKVSSIVASTPTTFEIMALGSKCKMNLFVVGHGGAGDSAGGGSGMAIICNVCFVSYLSILEIDLTSKAHTEGRFLFSSPKNNWNFIENRQGELGN